ncbi:TCP-1/cpn60 chaperonin family protein [Actinopolymorpha alba]|uniref:TCP-1/cpn60 chaperonin family protein n=1 Tax=Actinopolymorpha alba TaxID=533267 RepID=UPI0003656270|nr:TCP-1/cpn60 chaperonin family protein [Actinopolymorpha alba]
MTETMARLLAATLGPVGGVVLNDTGRGVAEHLTDSATIARRLTSLAEQRQPQQPRQPRAQRAGTALLREMVRRVGERHGDGGATAAVLLRGILRPAVRVVAGGANPVLVRRGIQRGTATVCHALEDQAEPVKSAAALVGMATAVTADPALGAVLGEMLDALGPDGAVRIEEHPATDLAYDYLEGAEWRARPADSRLLPLGKAELTLADPAVVVVADEITGIEQVRPLLEAALRLPGRPPLLVVATEISEAALAVFSLNELRGAVVSAPVVLSTARTHALDDLADLALLTGAEVVSKDLGRPLSTFRPEYAGRARRALVQHGAVTLVGGGGKPAATRDAAERLRARAWELDPASGAAARSARDRLWLRQARLLGRVGVLRVGAPTSQEKEERKANARKAVRLLRTALRTGAVPGGGVAYLDCLPAVAAAREACTHPDEALGVEAVRAGLEAPFLQIVGNAGQREPRVALHTVRARGHGYGVDVVANAVVEMRAAGIVDVAGVASGALAAAGETAGLLVSAEVVAARG